EDWEQDFGGMRHKRKIVEDVPGWKKSKHKVPRLRRLRLTRLGMTSSQERGKRCWQLTHCGASLRWAVEGVCPHVFRADLRDVAGGTRGVLFGGCGAGCCCKRRCSSR